MVTLAAAWTLLLRAVRNRGKEGKQNEISRKPDGTYHHADANASPQQQGRFTVAAKEACTDVVCVSFGSPLCNERFELGDADRGVVKRDDWFGWPVSEPM